MRCWWLVHLHVTCSWVLTKILCHAEDDRLEVRRQTNEQDKHLDVISDALSDLQRIGEVTHLCMMNCNTLRSLIHVFCHTRNTAFGCVCLLASVFILAHFHSLSSSVLHPDAARTCFQPCELTGFCCL